MAAIFRGPSVLPETGLVRFTFDDVAPYLEHLEPPERERLAAETALQTPDGFQIWGIPSGAKSVLRSLAPGDYLLLLGSPGPGARLCTAVGSSLRPH